MFEHINIKAWTAMWLNLYNCIRNNGVVFNVQLLAVRVDFLQRQTW